MELRISELAKQYPASGIRKMFDLAAGYDDVDYAYCPGRVPCAVAVIHKP